MNFTISFNIPPTRLTFEQASQIIRECRQFGIIAGFDGLTGDAHIKVTSPMQHEAFRIIDDNKAALTDVRGDGMASFTEYFNTKMPLDTERGLVYCTMCEEGRIW